ncbi:MAG: hypothetical protein HYZ81_04815 [Nitrospinae bacterium]|nr:hypothetical protein [Nitrospinota bacterium]
MSRPLDGLPGARLGMCYLFTSLGFCVLFNVATLLWYARFQAFYFREPHILGLTHLAALGWLTTGFMGIMYATLPATLGLRPNSLRMAHVQYWLQVIGVAGLVLTMSIMPNTRGRVVFGLLTLAALVVFAHNVAAIVGRGKVWRLPEAHFIMAAFYLAITGFIGVSYVFYLNADLVPLTMVHLKVHAYFAGLGWLALTLMGLTYKLLPLELGVGQVPQRWGMAASVLMNLVFWGIFFSYAYDWPALRVASAVLGLIGMLCHALQVWSFGHLASSPTMGNGTRGGIPSVSLPYTLASSAFGLVAGLLALLLTTTVEGASLAVEYACAYAAGAGWFGLYVTGQMVWLIPLLLRDEAHASVCEPGWMRQEFRTQVAGTALVAIGLLAGLSLLIALGAAVNLSASLLLTIRSVRLCRAQPAMAEK